MSAKTVRYKITDPRFYTQNPTRFLAVLRRSKPADLVSLRDKGNSKLKRLAKRFASVPLQEVKGISSDWKLARRVGISVVHFSGDRLEQAIRARRAGWFTIYSAHNLQELMHAKRGRIHLLTYSPIYPSPGKGRPLGLRRLRQATRKNSNIIALGGILNRSQIHGIQRTRAKGFASIRYFI